MTKYIITVTHNSVEPEEFDVPCETLRDLEAELRAWTNYVAQGSVLEVFRFNDSTLDYDLVDHIEA